MICTLRPGLVLADRQRVLTRKSTHVGEVGPDAGQRLDGRAAGGDQCVQGPEHVAQPSLPPRVAIAKGCVPRAEARVAVLRVHGAQEHVGAHPGVEADARSTKNDPPPTAWKTLPSNPTRSTLSPRLDVGGTGRDHGEWRGPKTNSASQTDDRQHLGSHVNDLQVRRKMSV